MSTWVNYYGEGDEDWGTFSRPERKEEDMEIVEVTLNVIQHLEES